MRLSIESDCQLLPRLRVFSRRKWLVVCCFCGVCWGGGFSSPLILPTPQQRQVKTIPASVLHYFRDGIFDKQPGNYHLFGRVGEGARAKMQPAPQPIDEGRPYKRHARILARLHADGRLTGDISGLTWYSWKDTGISMHTRQTSPVATKDQAGHTNLAVTSVYYHTPEENAEYRELENDLF